MLWKRGIANSSLVIFLSVALLFIFSGCGTKPAPKVEGQIEGTPGLSGQNPAVLPDLDENSTIDNYLKYAELNNPGLQAAFNDWKGALAKVPQAKSLDDPNLLYEHMIRDADPEGDNRWDNVELTQMFPFFGKRRLKKEVAMQSAEAAHHKYEAEKRKLVRRVKDAYYDYYYQSRAVEIVKENLELIKAMEEVVRVRYKTDEASYPDLLRMQVEIGKMEDESRTMTDMLKPKAAQLNAALNRPAESPVFVPTLLPEEKITYTYEEALARLPFNNPEITSMERDVAMAERSLRLAKIESLPDFMIGVEYRAVPMDAEEDRNPLMGMVGINIPLWRGKYRGMVAEAKAMYASAKGKLDETKNSLSAELEMALYEYRDAERKVSLYKDSLLPKASQSLSSVQQAFAAAKMGFLDLIDAIQTVLEFRLSYQKALTDRAKSIAMIEMLIGRYGE